MMSEVRGRSREVMLQLARGTTPPSSFWAGEGVLALLLPTCQNLSLFHCKMGTLTNALPVSKGRSIISKGMFLTLLHAQ